MRNILTAFLGLTTSPPVDARADRAAGAKEVFHIFVMGVYFFPCSGAGSRTGLWGKYRTVLYLSILYCLGHLFLALSENSKGGFYSGLFLIALGSGGIKPCVASFVGDQFDQSNKHLRRWCSTPSTGSSISAPSLPV